MLTGLVQEKLYSCTWNIPLHMQGVVLHFDNPDVIYRAWNVPPNTDSSFWLQTPASQHFHFKQSFLHEALHLAGMHQVLDS